MHISNEEQTWVNHVTFGWETSIFGGRGTSETLLNPSHPTALGGFCPEHPVFSEMDEHGGAERKNRWTDACKKQGPGTELYSHLS